MTRKDIRQPYPFHARNPRHSIECCQRPTYNRYSLRHRMLAMWARIRRLIEG